MTHIPSNLSPTSPAPSRGVAAEDKLQTTSCIQYNQAVEEVPGIPRVFVKVAIADSAKVFGKKFSPAVVVFFATDSQGNINEHIESEWRPFIRPAAEEPQVLLDAVMDIISDNIRTLRNVPREQILQRIDGLLIDVAEIQGVAELNVADPSYFPNDPLTEFQSEVRRHS